MAKLFANSGDPDQMLHSAASDLGLHCLPSTLLRVSGLQWVKVPSKFTADDIFLFVQRKLDNISCESSALFTLKNTHTKNQNVVCCSCDWCFKGYC